MSTQKMKICAYLKAGTADAIRLVHPKLSSANRVMVVSGDLITDFAVHHLTDLHALHNASVTALYGRYVGQHTSLSYRAKLQITVEQR